MKYQYAVFLLSVMLFACVKHPTKREIEDLITKHRKEIAQVDATLKTKLSEYPDSPSASLQRQIDSLRLVCENWQKRYEAAKNKFKVRDSIWRAYYVYSSPTINQLDLAINTEQIHQLQDNIYFLVGSFNLVNGADRKLDNLIANIINIINAMSGGGGRSSALIGQGTPEEFIGDILNRLSKSKKQIAIRVYGYTDSQNAYHTKQIRDTYNIPLSSGRATTVSTYISRKLENMVKDYKNLVIEKPIFEGRGEMLPPKYTRISSNADESNRRICIVYICVKPLFK